MARQPFTIYRREAFRFEAGKYTVSFDPECEGGFEFSGVVVRRLRDDENVPEKDVFELPDIYLIKEKESSQCCREDDEAFGPHNVLLHLVRVNNPRLTKYVTEIDERLFWYGCDENGDAAKSDFEKKHVARVPKKYCISDHEMFEDKQTTLLARQMLTDVVKELNVRWKIVEEAEVLKKDLKMLEKIAKEAEVQESSVKSNSDDEDSDYEYEYSYSESDDEVIKEESESDDEDDESEQFKGLLAVEGIVSRC